MFDLDRSARGLRRTSRRADRATSEVLGLLLMVFVTLFVVTTMGVFVLGSG